MGIRRILRRIENFHPYQTLLFLGMVSSGLIFLFLSIGFLLSFRQQFFLQGYEVPLSFYASFLVLAMSGVAVSKLLPLYLRDRFGHLREMVLSVVLLGLIFSLLQFLGWLELQYMGIRFSGLASESYLFVLTGIHVFHLMGALVFGLLLYLQIKRSARDPLQKMLFLINPYEKMKIRLFAIYWYFMDVVWIVLFVLIVASFH